MGENRKKGLGSIYQRGEVWWVSYYRNGRQFRESAKSTKEADALNLLKQRQGEIVKGEFSGLRVQKIRFEELKEDLLNDYRINNKESSLERLEMSLKHLDKFFKGMKAVSISTDRVNLYILRRREAGAENATINRELAALKRMLNLGHQMTPPKVVNVPYLPHLREDNVRQGYFEHAEYLALKKALPSYLRPVITVAYHTGMRKEEVLGLQWPQVDLMENKITLRPEDTKNKKGRFLFMTGELLEVIHFQRALRDAKFPKSPWVFCGETGERIRDFRGSWDTACINAGLCEPLTDAEGNEIKNKKGETILVPNKLFHDFRRTGVRNMVRAGVPERVAMSISGHKTRSVFDRYDITDEKDQKRASKLVEVYLLEQEKNKINHNSITICPQEAELTLNPQPAIN
jgi:integrase